MTVTGAALNFVMQSNLTLQANFADVQNPTVAITTNLLPVGVATNAIVAGTASDNGQVAAVNYQLNNGAYTLASGTNNWTAAVNLVSGTNIFSVYSVDAWGNTSATNVMIIAKAAGGITFGNLTQTYDGKPKPVTVITTPTNLPMSLTYNGVPAAPTNTGSYLVVDTVVDPDYQGDATNTLVIILPAITSPPTIQMQVTTGSVWLTWPQAYSNFTLQSTSDLKGGWSTNSGSPSVQGTNLLITLPATNRQRFYRLSQ